MTSSSKTRTLLLMTAVLAYWLAIFVATHIPGRAMHPVGHKDKVFHFAAFFGLSILLTWCVTRFHKLGAASYAVVVTAAAGYGILDELTQQFVPNRTCDIFDWLADVCGALAGAGLFLLAWRILHRPCGATG
jgi:VanZ family protein